MGLNMNLCSGCLQRVGLAVRYPHMLKSIKACDGCKSTKSSLDVVEVAKQLLITEK